jgi:hypothetical protein
LNSSQNLRPSVKKNVSYTIEWRISSSGGATLWGNQNSPIPIISDVWKPVAKIEIDGKWKEYYEQIGDYELNCYAFTCSINFTAENSYDPENNMIRFLWIYGRNDISLSRDPWGKKYELGDHTITLRVIDESWNYDEVHYSIHVLWPKSKAEKIKISSQEKSKKSSKKIQWEILASQKQKKAKKLKMVFFSSPSLILQGRTGKSVGQNTYICEYRKKPECGINFTLSETLKWYEYIWYLDDTEIYKGKNPKIWKLSPWSHTMKIVSTYKNSDFSLHEASYAIIVKSVPKKSKKIAKSKKSPKKNSQKITNIIPQAYAENKNTPSENSSSFPWVNNLYSMNSWLIYLKKKKNIIQSIYMESL